MMQEWVWFTLFAALMQAIRTAGQKRLATDLSPILVTACRYFFGLPFAILYVAWLARDLQSLPSVTQVGFIIPVILASFFQIFATVALIKLLTLRNFAVGTTLAKTEAMMTAILGSLFFATPLSLMGWGAVFVGVSGLVLITLPKLKIKSIDHRALLWGGVAGVCFALTSLWIREAGLSLNLEAKAAASFTLVSMIILQCVICLVWIALKNGESLHQLQGKLKGAGFIGLTSVLGSIGWFTAMTLENAAYVKILGQIEFFISLAITHWIFKESVKKGEYLGMGLVILSIVLLLFAR